MKILLLGIAMSLFALSAGAQTSNDSIDVQIKKIIASAKDGFKSLRSGAGEKDGSYTIYPSKIKMKGTEKSTITTDGFITIYVIQISTNLNDDAAASEFKKWNEQVNNILSKEYNAKTDVKKEGGFFEASETYEPLKIPGVISSLKIAKNRYKTSPWTLEIKISSNFGAK